MGGIKRSVYIFLCSLLGVLLFLVLHRVITAGYLVLIEYGIVRWTGDSSYIQFLALDYITLVLAMLAGSWYGIWLGTHWYEQVYESRVWSGAVLHLKNSLFPHKSGYRDLKARVEDVSHRLSADLAEVERLIPEIPAGILKPAPIKRRVVKKRALSRKKAA